MIAESFIDSAFRRAIVRVLDAIVDLIAYIKWYRPLHTERDPNRRLELELWLEISGARLGGMGASSAYVAFKSEYYDKLATEAEQAEVRRVLLSMLQSRGYSVFQKEAIAYVCSSLGMEAAARDVALVREASARGMTMHQLQRFNRDRERELRRRHLI
jgi:hypothetical protein